MDGLDHFPRAPITTSKTMTTRSPADETAAAVSSPDMAEATVSPARTNMMMKSTMIPRGVLIMLIIVPEFLAIVHTPPPKTEGRMGKPKSPQEFDGIDGIPTITPNSN